MSLIDDITENQKKFLEAQNITVDCIKSKSDETCKYYVKSPQHNLVEPLSNDDWNQIEKEFNKGKGGELKSKKGNPPNFQAVISSSALCVNNFVPFKKHYTKLSFLDYSGFDEAHFEQKLRTRLGGTLPHLDFYLASPKVVIGIESKFIEYFDMQAPNHPIESPTGGKKNNLEPYRNREKLHYLPKGFHESIIEHYFADDKPQHLDVAQLIKHTVGLLKNCRGKKPVLVYLYWEPFDPMADNLFDKHWDEIEKFKYRIERFIEFVPLSYPRFWKWHENDTLLKEHIHKVRERYGFSIQS